MYRTVFKTIIAANFLPLCLAQSLLWKVFVLPIESALKGLPC
jgi:hypothetical protein